MHLLPRYAPHEQSTTPILQFASVAAPVQVLWLVQEPARVPVPALAHHSILPQVLYIDKEASVALIEAGALGPELEAQLQRVRIVTPI